MDWNALGRSVCRKINTFLLRLHSLHSQISFYLGVSVVLTTVISKRVIWLSSIGITHSLHSQVRKKKQNILFFLQILDKIKNYFLGKEVSFNCSPPLFILTMSGTAVSHLHTLIPLISLSLVILNSHLIQYNTKVSLTMVANILLNQTWLYRIMQRRPVLAASLLTVSLFHLPAMGFNESSLPCCSTGSLF